jgi:hypothetical protein
MKKYAGTNASRKRFYPFNCWDQPFCRHKGPWCGQDYAIITIHSSQILSLITRFCTLVLDHLYFLENTLYDFVDDFLQGRFIYCY